MFERAVSVVTLMAFSLSSVSCVYYSHVPTPMSPEQLAQGGHTIHARAILTKSGGRIEFSGIVDARVAGGQLVVTGPGSRGKGETVRIAEADLVRPVSPNAGGVSGISTRDGVQFSGDIVTRKDGTITLAFTEVIVPMSAVDKVLVGSQDHKSRRATLAVRLVGGLIVIYSLLWLIGTGELR